MTRCITLLLTSLVVFATRTCRLWSKWFIVLTLTLTPLWGSRLLTLIPWSRARAKLSSLLYLRVVGAMQTPTFVLVKWVITLGRLWTELSPKGEMKRTAVCLWCTVLTSLLLKGHICIFTNTWPRTPLVLEMKFVSMHRVGLRPRTSPVKSTLFRPMLKTKVCLVPDRWKAAMQKHPMNICTVYTKSTVSREDSIRLCPWTHIKQGEKLANLRKAIM